MLKALLQSLLNLTSKKGSDGNFPNYDGQLYGSSSNSTFSYTAPSNGDFVIVPKIQRGVFYEICVYTKTNKIFASRFATDEKENTKSYTNFIRLNKGDRLEFELTSGTFIFLEWRFFPAKL